MSFKEKLLSYEAPSTARHLRIIAELQKVSAEEADAFTKLLYDTQVSAEYVSTAIAEEMPKHTNNTDLWRLGARQIQRIRKSHTSRPDLGNKQIRSAH